MKPSIATKWVKALRSGKYKQGKQALKTRSRKGIVRHCCLGVLCELYNKEHKNKLKTKIKNPDDIDLALAPGIDKCYLFSNRSIMLPISVKNWAGLNDACGLLKKGDGYSNNKFHWGTVFSLSEMNDEGATFNQIANFIEERYEDL